MELKTKVYIVEDYREFDIDFDIEDFETKEDLIDHITEKAGEEFEKGYGDIVYEVDENAVEEAVEKIWKKKSTKKR